MLFRKKAMRRKKRMRSKRNHKEAEKAYGFSFLHLFFPAFLVPLGKKSCSYEFQIPKYKIEIYFKLRQM